MTCQCTNSSTPPPTGVVPPFSPASVPLKVPIDHAACTVFLFPARSSAKSKQVSYCPKLTPPPHLTIHRLSPPMQSTYLSPPILTNTDAELTRDAQYRNRAYPVTVKQALAYSQPRQCHYHVVLTQKANMRSPASTLCLFGQAVAHPSSLGPTTSVTIQHAARFCGRG